MSIKHFWVVVLVMSVLVGCGGGSSTDGTTTAAYTIGGTVTGLTGTVVLQNNNGDNLSVNADGPFTFATSVADNNAYAVSVLTQPTGQTCSVSTGAGTVSGVNISNVTVTCSADSYTIGGVVSGLTGTVVLQNNSGDDLSVNADGPFIFATSVANNNTYAVSVLTQPIGQTCSVSTGAGTVSGSNISNVAVICSADSYTIGGVVSGLTATVVLQNNNSDDLTVSEDGNFTFTTPVADGSPYSITVLTQPNSQTCTVSSGSGTVAAAVSDVAVSCVAKTWETATRIEIENFGYTEVQTAFDASGNALAVWQQADGTRYNLWANRYTVGTGWGIAELIETEYRNATEPQIVADASGNAIVVWVQNDALRDNIWANRYTAGTGWGTAEPIESLDLAADSAKIAMDSDGNAMVVWRQTDGIKVDIWARRYVVGSGWETAQKIESLDYSAMEADIAMDGNGNAMAVWGQWDGGSDSIWANRYTVGTGWGTAVKIESSDYSAEPQGGTSIAMDADGNAMAVWLQHDGTSYYIWANRYTAGTGWGTAEKIESMGSVSSEVNIAIDVHGNALAVWQRSSGASSNLWVNRYTAGTGWGTAKQLNTATIEAWQPDFAFDSYGNAFVVWVQNDGMNDDIWARRYTAGTGWGTAFVFETADFETPAFDAARPSISIDTNGNALVLWEQLDDTSNNLWYRLFQ